MAKKKVNDIFVRIACILAALALWVFIINTTNPSQRMTFHNIPVQIQNAESLLAKGLILAPNQNPTTRVHLEGAASDLYTINEDAINVILDVNQRTLQVGEQDVLATFVQTPKGVALSGANPTVRLILDEYLQRPVDIKKDRLDYEAAQGFFVPEPQLELTFVTVSGPKTAVDKVAAVKPISQVKNISATTREVVKLEALDASDHPVANVTLSESYVEVTYIPQPTKEVPVEPIWQGTNTAINLTNIKTAPATVRIAARESVLAGITKLRTAPLDLAAVEPGETNRVKALEVPNEVTVLNAAGEPMAPEVKVITTAEAVATRDFSKPVSFLGAPQNGQLMTLPETISVTVSGPGERLAELSETNIIIIADISGLAPGTHDVAVQVDLPKDFVLLKTVPAFLSVKIQ